MFTIGSDRLDALYPKLAAFGELRASFDPDGTYKTVTLRDGWTIRTRDRARAAHHEHTVLVTHDGARLLTA